MSLSCWQEHKKKVQDLLDGGKRVKKGITVNWQKTEFIIVKRKSSKCELRNVDVNIKQIQQFKYLASVLTN